MDLHVKIYIYTKTVMADGLFIYEINFVIFCFYASLSHQRFHCKAGLLFLYSSSMSQVEPGFIYILASLSFQITTHLKFTAAVLTVFMIVAKMGRH